MEYETNKKYTCNKSNIGQRIYYKKKTLTTTKTITKTKTTIKTSTKTFITIKSMWINIITKKITKIWNRKYNKNKNRKYAKKITTN